ncbi:hypothetical protein LCGC14_1089780, partial [marine sediment metagenome]
ILAIGGKPGLYKLVTQTRGGFVAESLLDKKRTTVGLRSNVSVLSEIAIYTLDEELPLQAVFLKIQEKEEGGKTSVGHKDDKLKLEEYFFEILPNYDEDRVYVSDIKKVIQWYNILHENGITDFSNEKDAEKEGKTVEKKSVEKQSSEPKPVVKKTSNQKTSSKKVTQKNPAAKKK